MSCTERGAHHFFHHTMPVQLLDRDQGLVVVDPTELPQRIIYDFDNSYPSPVGSPRASKGTGHVLHSHGVACALKPLVCLWSAACLDRQ